MARWSCMAGWSSMACSCMAWWPDDAAWRDLERQAGSRRLHVALAIGESKSKDPGHTQPDLDRTCNWVGMEVGTVPLTGCSRRLEYAAYYMQVHVFACPWEQRLPARACGKGSEGVARGSPSQAKALCSFTRAGNTSRPGGALAVAQDTFTWYQKAAHEIVRREVTWKQGGAQICVTDMQPPGLEARCSKGSLTLVSTRARSAPAFTPPGASCQSTGSTPKGGRCLQLWGSLQLSVPCSQNSKIPFGGGIMQARKAHAKCVRKAHAKCTSRVWMVRASISGAPCTRPPCPSSLIDQGW